MDDVRDRVRRELERLELSPGGLEKTLRRVRRRERNRRIGAGALSLVLTAGVAAGLWFSFGRQGGQPVAERISPRPSNTVAQAIEANMRETLREIGPLCDRSSVRGDFDGDRMPDVAVIAAKRPATGCPSGSAPRQWVLAVAWSSGAAGSWPLPECGAVQPGGSVTPTGVCQAFAAPDINGDGRAELAVKTLQAAGSISGLQFYEVLPSEAPKVPVEVAAGGPGPGSIAPGQVFVVTFGSSSGYEDNLRCERAADGSHVLVSTDAEARGNRWAVYEGVWRFDGEQIAMLSHRTYSVAKHDPPAADLLAGDSICGAPITHGSS